MSDGEGEDVDAITEDEWSEKVMMFEFLGGVVVFVVAILTISTWVIQLEEEEEKRWVNGWMGRGVEERKERKEKGRRRRRANLLQSFFSIFSWSITKENMKSISEKQKGRKNQSLWSKDPTARHLITVIRMKTPNCQFFQGIHSTPDKNAKVLPQRVKILRKKQELTKGVSTLDQNVVWFCSKKKKKKKKKKKFSIFLFFFGPRQALLGQLFHIFVLFFFFVSQLLTSNEKGGGR
jgi:hypothetical protein